MKKSLSPSCSAGGGALNLTEALVSQCGRLSGTSCYLYVSNAPGATLKSALPVAGTHHQHTRTKAAHEKAGSCCQQLTLEFIFCTHQHFSSEFCHNLLFCGLCVSAYVPVFISMCVVFVSFLRFPVVQQTI